MGNYNLPASIANPFFSYSNIHFSVFLRHEGLLLLEGSCCKHSCEEKSSVSKIVLE